MWAKGNRDMSSAKQYHKDIQQPVLVMLGLVVALVAATAHASTCTPAPCAADGICLPKRATWGWYQTHWRPWPGEQVRPTPTPAEQTPTGQQGEQENLGQVQLPDPNKEDQTGPETPEEERREAPAPETPATEIPSGGETAPLVNPLESLDAPSTAPPTAPNNDPFGAPVDDVFGAPTDDPFGALPLPANTDSLGATSIEKGPRVEIPAAPAAGSSTATNLQGEDAPPALPENLRQAAWNQVLPSRAVQASPPESVAAAGQLPRGPQAVGPAAGQKRDRQLRPASTHPTAAVSGIRLINPAAAIEVGTGETGPRQALYIEASDQSAEE
jgi:hypothetical protein